jgi:hypothetical protein
MLKFAGGFFKKDTWIGLGLALAAFAVYLSTLSPSVGPDDTGELAAVAATLGVAHPTGYPLFTLIGWIFAHLPLGDLRVIVKLNVMVAIFCSTAVFVFYRLFLVLLRESLPPLNAGANGRIKGRKGANLPKPRDATESPHPLHHMHQFAAAAGALALAFFRIFWSNALILEVYALHLVFLGLTLLLFVLYLRAERDRDSGRNRLWLLFAYVFGLSFANHMMTVLLFPALLYLYFASRGFTKPAWMRIVQGIPLFLLGLTPYLYLPLRAATGPLMNWGDPSTWTNFWAHISAQQYAGLMFHSVDHAVDQFRVFLAELPRNLGYGPLLLALFGLVRLWRTNRRIAAFSSLIFATSVFYAINYELHDPNFRLNAHVMAAFWAACGAVALVRRAPAGSLAEKGMMAVVSVLALMPLAVHYRALDVSDHYAVEDYALNMLNSAEKGAVIVSDQEQAVTFPAYYLQLVEGVRPDVTFVTRSMLDLRWYYGQLERRDPELIRRAQPEIGTYVTAVSPLRLDEFHADDKVMARRYREAFQSLLQKGASGRPVYVTLDVLQEVTQAANNGIVRTEPEGLLYHLFYDTATAPGMLRDFSYRPLCAYCDSVYIGFIRHDYAAAYTAQGVRAAQGGDLSLAENFFRKALAVDSTHAQAAALIRQVEQVRQTLPR